MRFNFTKSKISYLLKVFLLSIYIISPMACELNLTATLGIISFPKLTDKAIRFLYLFFQLFYYLLLIVLSLCYANIRVEKESLSKNVFVIRRYNKY